MKGSITFLNTKYVESIIVALLKGTEVPSRSSELVEQVGYNDLPWHKAELFKEIYHTQIKLGDKFTIVQSLAAKLAEALIPGALGKLKIRDIRYIQHTLTHAEYLYHHNYLICLAMAEDYLGNLDWLDNFGPEAIHEPIEFLIDLNKKVSTLKERLALVERTMLKKEGNKSRLVMKSPLQALKFVLKANKHRPE
jgi:hypothetical protein